MAIFAFFGGDCPGFILMWCQEGTNIYWVFTYNKHCLVANSWVKCYCPWFTDEANESQGDILMDALVAKLGSNPDISDFYTMPFLLHGRKIGQ